MSKLYLVWNSYKRGTYIPIGVLEKQEDNSYKFMYFYESAVSAQNDGCILPFPLTKEPYVSNNLFPFFKDRIMALGRDNLGEYLSSMNMEEYDEFLLLSTTKGVKINDNFKVYTPEEYKSMNYDKSM